MNGFMFIALFFKRLFRLYPKIIHTIKLWFIRNTVFGIILRILHSNIGLREEQIQRAATILPGVIFMKSHVEF